MSKRSWFVVAMVGLLGVGVALISPAAPGIAQGALRIGGSQAYAGVFSVTGGFVPDPQTFGGIQAGGSMDARSLGILPNCRGFVAQQPDVIVHYMPSPSFPWARFFVRGSGDTTMIINDAAGRWWCSDDEGGGLNPMIDISNPPGGQYDIWVGSYSSGRLIPATLYLTELTSNRP